jgi:hypothetical protein
MAKRKLTIYVEQPLTDAMKIEAVKAHRSLSDIVEELFERFLKEAKRKP